MCEHDSDCTFCGAVDKINHEWLKNDDGEE